MPPILSRRAVIASLAATSAALLSGVARAGLLDSLGMSKLLGNASDKALNKLASKALRFGDKLGLTTKLTKSLNDAASLAALEAKPIFRSAISQIKLKDVPGLATQKDGASQFLLRTAGPDLHLKVKPLIAAALTKVGAYQQMARVNQGGGLLGSLGLTEDKLTESVSKQAMNGIFNYIGLEEAKLRANPLGIL
jgi:hypothetical protein